MISAQCWLNKEIKTNINPKIVIPVVNTNRIIISVKDARDYAFLEVVDEH